MDPKPIRRKLLPWYRQNARDLPWRRSQVPYRVWVSEIMLQQTRVAAVLDHYRRFMREFPTVKALAKANEQRVLALWSGLGYYRRARMLHAAAKQIVAERNGRIPNSAPELQALPGIGRYTAAAIASICFAEPVAVVDGNVERVLARLSGRKLKSAQTWKLAQQLICPRHPGDFNQAMMELGALVCTPQQPRCDECPLKKMCRTRGVHEVSPPPRRRVAELSYALHRRKGSVALVQRAKTASLMPGMWELPHARRAGEELFAMRHSITHTDYVVSIWRSAPCRPRGAVWINREQLSHLPLTGITRKALRRAGLLCD